jgi:hypothetical protein
VRPPVSQTDIVRFAGVVVELSGEVTAVEAADGGGPPSRLCGSPRRETARRW